MTSTSNTILAESSFTYFTFIPPNVESVFNDLNTRTIGGVSGFIVTSTGADITSLRLTAYRVTVRSSVSPNPSTNNFFWNMEAFTSFFTPLSSYTAFTYNRFSLSGRVYVIKAAPARFVTLGLIIASGADPSVPYGLLSSFLQLLMTMSIISSQLVLISLFGCIAINL